jgi:putative Mn2+ efflux pump MntP
MKLILFVLPLGLDTFAIAAALGMQGLPRRQRLRVSLLMSAFEMVMPVVGLLIGRGLGTALGGIAEYIAIAILIAAGAWLLFEDEEAEGDRVGRLAEGHGLAVVALGISISIDELAIGFSIGLLHLHLWLAILLIGAQAFLFAQAGLRLGNRLNQHAREAAEKLAAVALFGLALLLLIEQLA